MNDLTLSMDLLSTPRLLAECLVPIGYIDLSVQQVDKSKEKKIKMEMAIANERSNGGLCIYVLGEPWVLDQK